MEKFLAENPGVAYFTIGGLFTLIFWLIKLAVKDTLNKIAEHDKRMDDIEFNYKDEFKRVREGANDKHLEILGVLTEVRIEIAELKGNNQKQSKGE